MSMWRWTVRRKLSVALVVVALVPLAGVSYFAFVSERDALREDALDDVASLAAVQEARLDAFLDAQMEVLQQVSSRTQLRLSLRDFLEAVDPDASRERAETIIEDAQRSTSLIRRILIVDANGAPVADSDDVPDSAVAGDIDPIERGSAGPTVVDLVRASDGSAELVLAGPLALDGRFLGVVVITVDPAPLFDLVSERAGLGDTGETIVARGSGEAPVFIVPLRFDADAALTRRVPDGDENPMRRALSGEERVFAAAPDYRGETVIAASRFLPDVEWGVVVKVDRAEALAPVDRLRDLLILAFGVATVVVAALAWALGRSLSQPIRRLTEAAYAVRRGDLETRAEVATSDETAELADAFNEMTAELLESNRALETRVDLRAAALRDSEERLRSVFQSATDAYVATDKDGRIVEWNDAAERTFGWRRNEVIGRHLPNVLVPARYRRRHQEAFRRYVETGHETIMRRRIEMEALHRDGHEVPVELVLWPMPEGAKLQINCFLRDVSERREAAAALEARTAALAESEERFRHAFEDAPVGMALTAPDGTYLQVNPALCQFLGRSEGELLGQRWQAFTHPDDMEVSEASVREALESTGTYQIEKRYLHGHGHPVWALLSVSVLPSPGGHERALLAHVLDITARKEMEHALQHSNMALEEFAYVASHDLREPLRVITGFVRLLQERHAEALGADATEYMEFIGEAVDRMHSLLEDLLAMSRVQRVPIETSEVDLRLAVGDVLTDLSVAIEECQAHVDVGELPTLETDAGLLHRILLNLVSNALKFVPEDRNPDVAVRSVRLSGAWRIEVHDNGFGVEPRFRDRIFQMFQRLHSHEEYEGSGVGLALVKISVERLGGSVGVDARTTGGSIFWFTLPDAPAGNGVNGASASDQRDHEHELS